MDAFYASIEQRDRPELRGQPVAVGGTPSGRGVVAAASYEARRYGVRSAMSSARALKLCPHLVFVPTDMAKYKATGLAIREIFHEVTPLVEPLSLDEAYLDVTDNALGEPLAGKVALWLKRVIKERFELTASAGVGPSKLVAKIASDMDKPDGLVIVPPDRVDAFLAPLSVRKLWGVGPATAARLKDLGIQTVADVRARSVERLTRALGSYGAFLHRIAHGDDPRAVQPHRIAKSRGAETTFPRDVLDLGALVDVLAGQASSVARSLVKLKRPGRTVTIKVRYDDFETITRSRTLPAPTDDAETIAAVAAELLNTATEAGKRPVRLVGVSVSGLVGPDEAVQLRLDL